MNSLYSLAQLRNMRGQTLNMCWTLDMPTPSLITQLRDCYCKIRQCFLISTVSSIFYLVFRSCQRAPHPVVRLASMFFAVYTYVIRKLVVSLVLMLINIFPSVLCMWNHSRVAWSILPSGHSECTSGRVSFRGSAFDVPSLPWRTSHWDASEQNTSTPALTPILFRLWNVAWMWGIAAYLFLGVLIWSRCRLFEHHLNCSSIFRLTYEIWWG